jgi:hypothetical protein
MDSQVIEVGDGAVKEPNTLGKDVKNITGYLIFSGIVSRIFMSAFGWELSPAETLDLFWIVLGVVNVAAVVLKRLLDKHL